MIWNGNVSQFAIGAVILGFMVLVYLVLRYWYRKPVPDERQSEYPEPIELSALGTSAPPSSGPRLEVYHNPVRLSLLVLAPVGRDARLPRASELPLLVDQCIPGLMHVLNSHQPEFRQWPPQLSSDGFVQAFFGHVILPGERGRGTPWCSLAGKAEAGGSQLLIGLVCHAENENSLGQIPVAHPGKWLDIVQVKQ